MAYAVTPYQLSQAQQDVAAANANTQNANFRQAELQAGAPQANVEQTQAITGYNRANTQNVNISNQEKLDALRSSRAIMNSQRASMGMPLIQYTDPVTGKQDTYFTQQNADGSTTQTQGVAPGGQPMPQGQVPVQPQVPVQEAVPALQAPGPAQGGPIPAPAALRRGYSCLSASQGGSRRERAYGQQEPRA